MDLRSPFLAPKQSYCFNCKKEFKQNEEIVVSTDEKGYLVFKHQNCKNRIMMVFEFERPKNWLEKITTFFSRTNVVVKEIKIEEN